MGTGISAASGRLVAGVGCAAFLLAGLAGCKASSASEHKGKANAPENIKGGSGVEQVDPSTWRKWGLKPMRPAPAPPADADKPIRLSKKGPAKVFSTVPTKEKIVFVTIDDGAEKDPRFVEMARELRVPFTMFLMNDAILANYGYFKPLQALGNHVQNHTLNHPVMRNLGPEAQKAQICGDQTILVKQYTTRPYLFRPPYGMYNMATQEAAASCGIHGIALWRESMQIHDMQYDDGMRKLHPGDIILAHFRGPKELKGSTMTQMFAALLKHITKQGYTVARLEDYVRPPA
ncbi:polysaccharide deacetylase family protein [Actinomadura oligospora]|uniref:polysaccharide deacetylase family protein n=1 Tax=Actinomadura oligospora TaxID=111804 RepID=UPI00047BBC40|nr:polysaccharide deacetylase family protein [Actinomadura oligospora]